MTNLASLRVLALIATAAHSSFCQTAEFAAANVGSSQSPEAKPLPPYLVYRHFLAWVNELDKAAVAAKATDPYQFAQPFSRANLQHTHLDILLRKAHQLAAESQKQDAKAQSYIDRYRAQARDALSQGLPLPPPPSEVHDLNLQRTALFIHHYVALRSELGPDIAAQLDSYLAYEFTPHIKLRKMAAPALPPSP